jgi:hypothetical protein
MVSDVRFELTFFLVPNQVPLTRLGESEFKLGCGVMDSNHRSSAYETDGMTTSLTRKKLMINKYMNNYCTPLNLEFPLFDSDLNPMDFLKSLPVWRDNIHTNLAKAAHFQVDRDLLSNEVRQFFNDHEQNIFLCEVFYRLPGGKGRIHIDTGNGGDYSKINWVFGGGESYMHWYTPKDGYQNKEQLISPIATSFVSYEPSEVNLMYSAQLSKPSIVQVGVPHNVINGDQERFAVCMVFFDRRTRLRPTLTEARDIFKNYIT